MKKINKMHSSDYQFVRNSLVISANKVMCDYKSPLYFTLKLQNSSLLHHNYIPEQTNVCWNTKHKLLRQKLYILQFEMRTMQCIHNSANPGKYWQFNVYEI